MKKAIVFFLAVIMMLSAIPAVAVFADEAPAISYSDHLTFGADAEARIPRRMQLFSKVHRELT